MPEKSALCPYLSPKPSRALATFLLGVHALSFLAAWLNPLPVWLRSLIALGVLLSLWLNVRRSRAETEIIGLRIKPDVAWDLHTREGPIIEASLLGSSLVNPWFVLLHFRAEKKRYSLLICRDSLNAEEFRRLRVTLRVVGRENSGNT